MRTVVLKMCHFLGAVFLITLCRVFLQNKNYTVLYYILNGSYSKKFPVPQRTFLSSAETSKFFVKLH